MEEYNFSSTEIKTTNKKGQGVFAKRDFEAGETVIIGEPDYIAEERTQTSVQTGIDKHTEFQPPVCFLNHSCDPNLGVRDNDYGGYDFLALRNIKKDEELNFDYETTEYISISVKNCFCGAKNCRKKIKGYKFLEKNEKLRYKDFIPLYLQRIERNES